MPYYRPQNEQAQVHIAAAFAKQRNRLETFACISSVGPGATNMITGAATATVNRLPVLLFPRDYFANRHADPVLQQVEHPIEHDVSASTTRSGPVSRYFDRISRPGAAADSSLPEAFRVLTDPAETGAVTISLPEDVQAEAYDWPRALLRARVWRVRRPLPGAGRLVADAVGLDRAPPRRRSSSPAAARSTPRQPRRPWTTFATTYGIPVVETQAGKGALPWNHPLNVGPIGVDGRTRRQPAGQGRGPRDRRRHPDGRLRDRRRRTAFQDPDVTLRRHQRHAVRRLQDAGAAGRRPTRARR